MFDHDFPIYRTLESYLSEEKLRSMLSVSGVSLDREIPSHWSRRRQWQATTDAARPVFVKEWEGWSDFAALSAETWALERLAKRDVAGVPRMVRPPVEVGATVYTFTEFIDGEAVSESDALRLLPAMMDLLAAIQPCSALDAASRSQDGTTAALNFEHLACSKNPVIVRALRLVTEARPILAKLPVGHIHGDFNTSNLIQTTGGLCAIDFEFSRIDIRLLDLAAMFAPDRGEDGVLRRVPELSTEAILNNGYRLLPALSDLEIDLYPVVVVLHLLRILRDLTREDDRAARLVLAVLEEAVEATAARKPE